jgi:hypothetical protein
MSGDAGHEGPQEKEGKTMKTRKYWEPLILACALICGVLTLAPLYASEVDQREDGEIGIEAAPALAVAPVQGTLGTELTINALGANDFGEQKGKVMLKCATIGEAVLKVTKWTSTKITAILMDAMDCGCYDVVVQPRAKRAKSITLTGGFTVAEPDVANVTPTSGACQDLITITGNYFSTKKGTVTLEPVAGGKAKSCRVMSWKDTEIKFRVPNVTDGNYTLRVSNVIGYDDWFIPFEVK